MSNGKNKRIDVLAKAAIEKKRLSFEATDRAIRKLTTSNQPITVSSVAKLAGVSTSYIYKYPDLKERIYLLRNQQNLCIKKQKTSSDNSQVTIIHTLRQEIKNLNAYVAESQQTNQRLIGKLYDYQDSQNAVLNLKKTNYQQQEQIRQLQITIETMNTQLLNIQQELLNSQNQLADNENKKSAENVDNFSSQDLQLLLNNLGIKLNAPLLKLIQSSPSHQVKNALLFVEEVIANGAKVRSKTGLFRKALESEWSPNFSNQAEN